MGKRALNSLKNRICIFLLTAMVFFGAALLFTMEPLVGRLLTPYFGGASHVWLTCLMFFQAMLFIGYFYAHLIEQRIGVWHLLLLILPLVVLPLDITAKVDANSPLTTILGLLFFRVGLPFVTLSTTAVVAQSWLFRSYLGRVRDPYPLYAASNAGSLIALIGYIFIVEPLIGVRIQRLAWSGAYGLYVILVVTTWFMLRPGNARSDGNAAANLDKKSKVVMRVEYVRWLLLSALPSAYLLAITNYITLEVGSFPLFWVMPLAIYLGSFIVTFRNNGGVPGFLRLFWLEVLLAGLGLYALGLSHWLLLAGHLCVFFMVCLVSHGLLYESRPEPNRLTRFYVASAFGGWMGGVLVALIAPIVFSGLYEYPIVLFIFGAVFWWNRNKTFTDFWPKASRVAALARMIILGALVTTVILGVKSSMDNSPKFRHRNFYGTYKIFDTPGKDVSPPIRTLVHGKTLHGAQILDPKSRLTPISYYYEGGPISDVYRQVPSPRRLAVIGLGSGAISTYAGSNDILDYYEIDPDNERIARAWFTYLDECRGKTAVILGDGRLSLQDTKKDLARYDLIHVDAFTGDGIPTHLMTKEALLVYRNRLTENGIILLHISNRYYDLRPLAKAMAKDLGLFGIMNEPAIQSDLKPFQQTSQCVALTAYPGNFRTLIDNGWIPFGDGDGLEKVASWTDDYINILSPLSIQAKAKFNKIKNSKAFSLLP